MAKEKRSKSKLQAETDVASLVNEIQPSSINNVSDDITAIEVPVVLKTKKMSSSSSTESVKPFSVVCSGCATVNTTKRSSGVCKRCATPFVCVVDEEKKDVDANKVTTTVGDSSSSSSSSSSSATARDSASSSLVSNSNADADVVETEIAMSVTKCVAPAWKNLLLDSEEFSLEDLQFDEDDKSNNNDNNNITSSSKKTSATSSSATVDWPKIEEEIVVSRKKELKMRDPTVVYKGTHVFRRVHPYALAFKSSMTKEKLESHWLEHKSSFLHSCKSLKKKAEEKEKKYDKFQ